MKATKILLIAVLILALVAGAVLAFLFFSRDDVPNTWQEAYDLGVRYLSEGNYQEAIIAFSNAIAIDPRRPDAYAMRGLAYYQIGDYTAAAADMDAAIALSPDEELYQQYRQDIQAALETVQTEPGLNISDLPEETVSETIPETTAPEPTVQDQQVSRRLTGLVRMYGDGRDEYEFLYNADGFLTDVKGTTGIGDDDEPVWEQMTYDSQGRLIEKWIPTSIGWMPFPVSTYTYNDAGQLISSTSGEGSVSEYTYFYDDAGTLIQVKSEHAICNGTTDYFYDENGLLVRTVSRTEYDDATRPVQVDESTYQYDDEGRLIHVSSDAGVDEYAYDYKPFILNTYRYSYENTWYEWVSLRLEDPEGHTLWSYSLPSSATYAVDADGYLTRVVGADGYSGEQVTCYFLYDGQTLDDVASGF